MDFRTKSYLTLTKRREGLLGPEMYILPEGLMAYSRAIHDPDYYLAESDKDNWKACVSDLADYIPCGTPTMEYGTGDAETVQKTARVIKLLESSHYTAVDLSKTSLEMALQTITSIKKDIEAVGLEIDFWAEDFPLSNYPTLALFSGGSIANFDIPVQDSPPFQHLSEAFSILGSRTNGGWVLLSVDMWDLNRDANYYEKAYFGPDHSLFNLSIFSRMRRELDTNIDPEGFRYFALFNNNSGAIQHMACATKSQKFLFDGEKISIVEGETFLLQNSFRFKEELFERCVERADLAIQKVWKHPGSTMRLYLLRKMNRFAIPIEAKIASMSHWPNKLTA